MASRKKRRKNRRKRSVIRTLLSLFILCTLLALIALGGGALYIAETAEPINASNIYSEIDQTSYIYDKNGNLIDELHYGEDRKLVTADEIPSNLKLAVISIEDKTFYRHHGFNIKRMAGAVISKILGRADAISGTSTISQQLARNVFLSDIKSERTIKRKATEMYYAWQIEQALSKEDILEAYLNSIYLGYGCYGVGAAARTYFSKDVSELTLAECAALAALPQAPDLYALIKDEEGDACTPIEGTASFANDLSKDRRDLVIDLMKEQGYIREDEAEEATVDISSILNPDFGRKTSSFTYFTDYVADRVAKDLMSERGLTEEAADRLVHTGGLRIYSTIDSDAQKAVIKEFRNEDNFPSCYDGKTEPEASMVITEVGSGKIIAMAGGRKEASGHQLFNRATSPRQPGSAIKPLSVYSAALQKSYELHKEGKGFPFQDFGYEKQGKKYWGKYITAGSYVLDEKMRVNGQLWPLNANRVFTGKQTFRTALQQSINTCAVKIQLQVGTDYSVAMLKAFGISTLVSDVAQPTNDVNPAALALGAMTYGATPLDMALAYAAFPNKGERTDAVCYTTVEDAKGNTILTSEAKTARVVDEGVAFIMTDVLKSVVSRGIAGNAALPDTEVGGKTGTTNDAFDIWFCGFTPKYSAALWIGTDHNKEMNATSSSAAALWSKIVGQIDDYAEGEYPKQPSDVITYSGEYYTRGTEGGAYLPKSKKKSESSNSNSDGTSGSSSREEFVRNFNGGSSGSSSPGSSNRSSESSSSSESEDSGSSSREEWLRKWQEGN